jgi:hypothetical protein
MSLNDIKKEIQIPGKGQNVTYEFAIPLEHTRLVAVNAGDHVPENGGTCNFHAFAILCEHFDTILVFVQKFSFIKCRKTGRGLRSMWKLDSGSDISVPVPCLEVIIHDLEDNFMCLETITVTIQRSLTLNSSRSCAHLRWSTQPGETEIKELDTKSLLDRPF